MKEITIRDLQELGRLLKGVRCRPMSDEEIAKFGVVPEGASVYSDYGSYREAVDRLGEAYETFCDKDKGLFWTIEL